MGDEASTNVAEVADAGTGGELEQGSQAEAAQQPEQATNETAKEAAGKGDGKEPKDGKKPIPEKIKGEKGNGWVQARISRYASETRAAREETKLIREKLEQMEAQQRGGTQRRADQRPNQDDYASFEDYADALVEWKVAQRDKVSREQQAQQGMDYTYQQRRAQFDQQVQQFAMGYEDPQAVMQAMFSEDVPISDAMGEAIMDLGEKGPEVLLYLAQNPMEAMSIARMSPRMATMQIGLLSLHGQGAMPAQANGQPPAQPQVQPKPVPQIRGSSPANAMDATPSDRDGTLTWAQKEAARIRAKYGPNVRMYIPRG